jgi:hypothetical protein
MFLILYLGYWLLLFYRLSLLFKNGQIYFSFSLYLLNLSLIGILDCSNIADDLDVKFSGVVKSLNDFVYTLLQLGIYIIIAIENKPYQICMILYVAGYLTGQIYPPQSHRMGSLGL